MNDTPTSSSPALGEKLSGESAPVKPVFQSSPLVKNSAAAYAVAKTLSLAWKVIESSPLLENLEKNGSVLWEKAKFLNHPYVRLDRGFVFIHVPKTAGTSLNKALGLTATISTPLHARAKDVLPFIRIIAPRTTAISWVRHPYTRFLSLYKFSTAEESLYHCTKNPESAPYGKHPDYDKLHGKSYEAAAELLVQNKLGDPGYWPHNWVPQVEWLVDKDGKLLVDFIGHVESIEADLKRLEQVHGIPSKSMPWLNKSADPTTVADLTPRTLELLRSYYKRDFEMLGYDE